MASYYFFENENISLVTGTVAALPQLIMALLVPKIIRKIDKATLFKISVVATIIFSILIVPTRNSLIMFIITYMLRAIPLGIIGVLAFTFTPDCAEYGQYTTGTEAKGITFAIQTFAVKLASAISGSLGLFLLGLYNFKTSFVIDGAEIEVNTFKDLAEINAIALQPDGAIDGFWITYNVVPIIGLVIALIIWNFYKLNDKDVQLMADYNVGNISKEEVVSQL